MGITRVIIRMPVWVKVVVMHRARVPIIGAALEVVYATQIMSATEIGKHWTLICVIFQTRQLLLLPVPPIILQIYPQQILLKLLQLHLPWHR